MAQKTPQVNFSFTNENVQASVPLLGISHVVARTTRGPFNTPDRIFTSMADFRRTYGSEIVPDGSVSNIEKAFELGSQLRISRVEGAGEVSKGIAKKFPVASGTTEPQVITIGLINPQTNQDGSRDRINLNLTIKTQEEGSSIIDDTGYNLNRNFFLTVNTGSGPVNRISLIQSRQLTQPVAEGPFSPVDIIASNLMFSGSIFDADEPTGQAFIEPQVFQDFTNQVPNIEFAFKSATKGTGETPEVIPSIRNMDDVMTTLRTHQNWFGDIFIGTEQIESSSSIPLQINEGNNGGESDDETWLKAYESIRSYEDGYQLILSHIHQHIPSDYLAVYKGVAEDVNNNYEIVLYVEIPKYNSDGSAKSPEDIITFMGEMLPTVGQGKNVAYFGGGIKYYDQFGSKRDCDILGSILGLGDAAASNFGPWYSFAGQNRGVIFGALGPVTENLGSSASIPMLNNLATWYVNLFVVKDTRTSGKQTMLQQAFTSNPKNDSEKFLSIVRLNLYLKKNLRPLLESYLEEPNTFETWRNIFFEAREILDDLQNRNAIESYEWLGDQNETSYANLQINNEADVRQGKYRVVLKYTDIVPMQEITMDITINTATSNIGISISSNNLLQ